MGRRRRARVPDDALTEEARMWRVILALALAVGSGCGDNATEPTTSPETRD